MFLLVFAMSLSAAAQEDTHRSVVNAVQAGTLTISNGTAKVELSKEVLNELQDKQNAPVYYVVFTPVGHHADIIITDKNGHSFSISARDGRNSTEGIEVDYVVFVRQTVAAVNAISEAQARKNFAGMKVK